MKEYENVTRYWPDEMVYRDRWEMAAMLERENGGYVDFDDYQELLQEYKELKYRMDNLEK